MWDGRPPTRVTLMDPVINMHDPGTPQVLRRVIPLLANALSECHSLLVSPQLPLREPASGSVDRARLAMSIRLEPSSDGDRAAAVVTVELIDGRSKAVMACAVAELPKPERPDRVCRHTSCALSDVRGLALRPSLRRWVG